jgi:long-chain acyl-CoA synthetase
MNFLENIFTRLEASEECVVLQEAHASGLQQATGEEVLQMIARARAFLRAAGVRKGDRCVLLAHNSIRWAALDLALMAEGIIVVPLYARQAAAELVAMMKDCQPALICCGDSALSDSIAQAWPDSPRGVLFDEIFLEKEQPGAPEPPASLADNDVVTIIYTSGTSGDAKGVMLNGSNVSHMLRCTTGRLDSLMGPAKEPDRVFHYLPFCFAGSWILLLSCLSRESVLTLSMDLTKLMDEVQEASPHYFLNVPTLLERMKTGIEANLKKRGGIALTIFRNAGEAWAHRLTGVTDWADRLWLGLANFLVFPPIRRRLGPNLRVLICGSAPLAVETQQFFAMLSIPVLQVYGLTETTAICTMDEPGRIELGRVGPAIEGVSMQLGENREILVRGPNIFPGYWNRPQEAARALEGGWFHTGDQGDTSFEGNWRIVGRIKNLIILNSGHNIAPEPIEERILRALPGVQHAVLIGNGRGYLAAILTGEVARAEVQLALDGLNAGQPHYKQIRAFYVSRELLTIENGLLTANGKLKRDAIYARFEREIEELYAANRVAAKA